MFAVAVFFLFAASLSVSPDPKNNASKPIGPDAVFKPASNFIDALHASCGTQSGDALGECFAAQMKKAGASPAALAFTRRMGNQAYLSSLRETGRVDVALAVYPFRANENWVWLLVNGTPPIVDVWDVAPLQKLLEPNSVYKTLRLDNTKILVFPRSTKDGPRVLPSPEGQRFAAVYDLKDCHACKPLGYAAVAYVFDAAGNFVGPELGQVKPYYH
jgi:hypothetical protein